MIKINDKDLGDLETQEDCFEEVERNDAVIQSP